MLNTVILILSMISKFIIMLLYIALTIFAIKYRKGISYYLDIVINNIKIKSNVIIRNSGGITKITYDGKTEIKKEYCIFSGTYELNELIKVPYTNADGSNICIYDITLLKEDGTSRSRLDKSYYELVETDGVKIISKDIDSSKDGLIIHFRYTPKAMVVHTI